jgi:hypothetical protein
VTDISFLLLTLSRPKLSSSILRSTAPSRCSATSGTVRLKPMRCFSTLLSDTLYKPPLRTAQMSTKRSYHPFISSNPVIPLLSSDSNAIAMGLAISWFSIPCTPPVRRCTSCSVERTSRPRDRRCCMRIAGARDSLKNMLHLKS